VEIVDRYLQAVKAWLTADQRDDILAELSEDLRSEVEEREAALGRPLGERETQALLEQRGHPLWLARGIHEAHALVRTWRGQPSH